MTSRHFDLIPKSVRREPIRTRDDYSGFDYAMSFLLAGCALLGLALMTIGVMALAILSRSADGHDAPATPPDVGAWYRSLMQPDNPMVSCCGESDAYWADSFEADGGQYVAIITDEREHAPLHRIPRANGTRVLVPHHKLKYDAGNPTGHGVIFIGGSGQVLCYVTPGGG